MRRILAYDLGTSGLKTSLYDETGRRLDSCYGQYPTLYPADGLREQCPADWWNAVRQTTRDITSRCGREGIAAIGVSGHSLGLVAVDDGGRLLEETTPIWSDARAQDEADRFFARTDYRQWYEETGNGFPRHLYALFKQMWLREHKTELYDRTCCFLGSKDYINLRLTGELATDRSYASGSGLYSLSQDRYLQQYLECADMDGEKLPRVAASHEVIGCVTREAAQQLGLFPGIPVVAGGVDNACMTLGANCRREGDAYASLGTSAWVTVCAKTPSINFEAKTYTFAHCIEGQFLPSAGIFSSASSLEWVIQNLLEEQSDGTDQYDRLAELVRMAPAGANNLMFIPNLAGGSSFDPSPDVRGLFAGLDLKHTRADVVRAVYEGIAMHLRCAYDVLAPQAPIREKLLLVGGGAKSSEWRRIYAEVFGLPVWRTAVVQDAASLGAAALAAVGAGIWKDYTPLDAAHGSGELTEPDQEEAEAYRKLLPKYKALCALTQDIAEIMRN